MRRIIAVILAATALCACRNDDISFPDYDVQTVYFPYQYPVRTLSLGNDTVDNSLDLAHEFNMGICIGGYYGSSKRDWKISYEVDESLVPDNLYNAAGDKLLALPASYYTLSPEGTAVLKKGTSAALIRVHLEDAFFDDPLALKGCYVIPVKITGVETGAEILKGKAKETVASPNIHNPEDWEVSPMDFSLFGVKYVNKYHGNYLRRGCRIERAPSGAVVGTTVYRKEYVEFDEVVSVESAGLNTSTVSLLIDGENWDLKLIDDGSGFLDLKSLPTSKYAVTAGSGEFVEGAETWGGTPDKPAKRDAIYLDYYYKNAAGNNCEICDTLVFRDRGIVFESARPEIR